MLRNVLENHTKDVSEAMSTMDFNFSFKNAIQMRSYNQFKTQEKKLKKELERSLADLTGRMEKQAQSTEDLTNGKDVDGRICKIVEDLSKEVKRFDSPDSCPRGGRQACQIGCPSLPHD